MKSAGKARNNGLYRHIRTSKEIIRNLLNDSDKSNGFDFMVMVMGTKSNLAYVPVFRRYFFCHFGRRTNCQREMVSSRL